MAEFRKILNIMDRMCASFPHTCKGCPLIDLKQTTCGVAMTRFPKNVEKIIMQWSKENSEIIIQWEKENSIKTNRDKFKEVFGVEVADDNWCFFNDSDTCEENSKCNKCELYNFWDKEYIEKDIKNE